MGGGLRAHLQKVFGPSTIEQDFEPTLIPEKCMGSANLGLGQGLVTKASGCGSVVLKLIRKFRGSLRDHRGSPEGVCQAFK